MKPYVDDPEEVAVNLMSSHNKAIAYYRDVDDGGVLLSPATDTFESSSSKLMNSTDRFRGSKHSTFNTGNAIQLEGPLHDAICTHFP